MAGTLEAFFAVEGSGPLGPTSYLAGYRCGATGNVVCALELPASIVETTILRDAKVTATVAPDGHIRFGLDRIAHEDIGDGLQSIIEPIDRLIAQFVSIDSLHLGEITSADLNSLLQRLHHSVALVQEAMEHLSSRHAENPR